MTERKDNSEEEMSDNLRITIVAVGGFLVLICCVIFDGSNRNAAVVKTADTPALEAGIQNECAGSTPVSSMEGKMKELKKYKNAEGKEILAYAGISRPLNQSDPFFVGYWVILDENGSEKFMKTVDFEKEYTEIN